jgi:hypothetical protein
MNDNICFEYYQQDKCNWERVSNWERSHIQVVVRERWFDWNGMGWPHSSEYHWRFLYSANPELFGLLA